MTFLLDHLVLLQSFSDDVFVVNLTPRLSVRGINGEKEGSKGNSIIGCRLSYEMVPSLGSCVECQAQLRLSPEFPAFSVNTALS